MDRPTPPRSNPLITLFLGVIAVALLILSVGIYSLIETTRKVASGPGEVLANYQTRIAELQNPTPTIRPSPATIVTKIQTLSRLESVSYSIEKVITAEQNQGPFGFLFGDRLLFVAHGEVIAGVDLAQMQPNDILVTGENSVVITMPAPQLLVVRLDNEKSYVYSRDSGIFAYNYNLETAARIAAEQSIREAALEDGILKLAEENSEATVRGLLLAFGYSDVRFITGTPVPTPTVLVVTPLP